MASPTHRSRSREEVSPGTLIDLPFWPLTRSTDVYLGSVGALQGGRLPASSGHSMTLEACMSTDCGICRP